MVGTEWLFRDDARSSPLTAASDWALSSLHEDATKSRLWEVVCKRRGLFRREAYAYEVNELLPHQRFIARKIYVMLTNGDGCLLLTDPPAKPPPDYELFREKLCAKDLVAEIMSELPGEFELVLERMLRETNRVALILWDGDGIVYFDRE